MLLKCSKSLARPVLWLVAYDSTSKCLSAGVLAAMKEPKISQVRAEALSVLNAAAIVSKVHSLDMTVNCFLQVATCLSVSAAPIGLARACLDKQHTQ